MKKCVLVVIICLLVSCLANKKYDYEEELKIVNERLFIIKISKKKGYYLIDAIRSSNDTISIISYINKKMIKNKKNKTKLNVEEIYNFSLMKVNVKVANGLSNRGYIIIKNDTLWRGDIVLNKSDSLKYVYPQIFESLNSEGLDLYN
ncbi:hypothetical protein [Myroides odoratus]|uniref:hypothetical protein n=1 Tax=Myroides odoratus TaxID=256 RepID=UPI0039AEE10F